MAVRDWLDERFTVIKRLPQSLQLRFLAATLLKTIEAATCAPHPNPLSARRRRAFLN
jgi:hypothetical protein